MAFPAIGIGAILGFLDFLRTSAANRQAEASRNQFQGEFMDYLNRGTDPRLNPAISFGGQSYGGLPGMGGSEGGRYFTGSAGDPLAGVEPGAFREVSPQGINLDNIFTGGQDALTAYQNLNRSDYIQPNVDVDLKGNLGEALSALGSAESRASAALGGIMPSAERKFDEARGRIDELVAGAMPDLFSRVDFANADLSNLERARLAQVSQAGERATQLGLQGIASQADMFGGLQNVGRQQAAFRENQSQDTLTSGLQTRADVEAQERAIEQFNAELAGRLSTAEAQIIRDLTGMQTDFESRAAGALTNLLGSTGAAEANLAANMGINRANLWSGLTDDELRLGGLNAQIGESNLNRLLGFDSMGVQLAQGPSSDRQAALMALESMLARQSGNVNAATAGMANLGNILQQSFYSPELLLTSLIPYIMPNFGQQKQDSGGLTGIDIGGFGATWA